MKSLKKLLSVVLLSLPLPALAAAATVYKDPNCGCCAAHAQYLREHGLEVKVVETRDLAAVKARYQVPSAQAGCHTTVIGNYVFEGHVPVESIQRVLAERPMIKGLTVPGMPAGSPGMGGAKQGPLQVYYLGEASQPRIYESR